MKCTKSQIHKTAIIYPNVVLGKNVYIGEYSVIGCPAEIKDTAQVSMGIVKIGDGTTIREHVTVAASRSHQGNTIVGKNCYIQAHSHVGHDVTLEDNVTVACYVCIGGHVVIGKYANLALHVVLHPRCSVGEGTIIGCNSFVKGDIGAWGVYIGNPCKLLKPNNYLRKKLGLEPIL